MPEIANLPRCTFPDALHNDPTPGGDEESYAQEVQCEKPWHRLAIMLAAQGCTVTEIAGKLERTIAWVSILLRQPWARERLTHEINLAGRDEIEVLLKGAGVDAMRKIVSLSANAANETIQLAASREILDRLLGKPVVRTETKAEVTVQDAAQLDQEIARLTAEENRLLGRN